MNDDDWDDIFSSLNRFGSDDEEHECDKEKCSCNGECSSKKSCCDDSEADICKKCGGEGKKIGCACICSKCGDVIWGC